MPHIYTAFFTWRGRGDLSPKLPVLQTKTLRQKHMVRWWWSCGSNPRSQEPVGTFQCILEHPFYSKSLIKELGIFTQL